MLCMAGVRVFTLFRVAHRKGKTPSAATHLEMAFELIVLQALPVGTNRDN